MDNSENIIKFLLEADDEEDDLWKDVTPEPPEPDQYDIWVETYRPIKNHIDLEAPYDETMFETYGAELDYVRAADPKHVWTLVSGDNNEDVITAGFHFVNRQGNFVTEVPWKDGTESFTISEGDPQTAEAGANLFINHELGRDWKNEWLAMPPEEQQAKVRGFAEMYDLENVLQEIITIVNRAAADV